MKTALLILEAVLGIIIVIAILLQPSKADALSGLIQGGNSESFFSRNKGRTKEALLVKITVITSILFALNTILLNLVINK
ncbi:preprotein translocase subunit SecG [Clostridium fallax]|uniref:Protein-export membrane protein SecG n=1 Tax=Clostridium fallax TaxID=1533 RepID=A0A1M4SML3_9CLOT|nr:preprotein translocase subunit SecG [Clostridium fallax]SHE33435.1 preprotein translocase subunit SecG [Clostridium fallax]SQB07894.1 preprotein translocase subunit SecG [Clostridium fallax]